MAASLLFVAVESYLQAGASLYRNKRAQVIDPCAGPPRFLRLARPFPSPSSPTKPTWGAETTA